jgi:hypothetical protein
LQFEAAELKVTSDLSSNYGKSLAIVVPYRDRAGHLQQFIPHLKAYFERDKLDRHLRYTVHIVEQADDRKFNKGKLCNCGFALAENDADYFCFHDVDYLPVWTDYSYCLEPTHLIRHGLHPVCRYPGFFGAVNLFNKEDFGKINGFSNEYWGWGEEDAATVDSCIQTDTGAAEIRSDQMDHRVATV